MNHIVRFDEWCKTCKYFKEDESTDICNECLNEPFNEDSKKPVNWQEQTVKKNS